jgi:glycosyltransferase involved in cell wall biosynthesis
MQREPHLAAKTKNIPSVVHVHEILNDEDENCRAIALPSADVYLTLSRLTSHAIANSDFTASRIPDFTTVNVVGNTTNYETLDIKNVIDPHRIVIGLISSNTPQKGLNDFIKLARILESFTPNAKFMIIGPENSHITDIKARLENLPINIGFGEYSDETVDAIRQANIIVNLSTCQETFGRTILEGMAARRPVLAYNNGAFGELINNNESGFLLPFGDIEAMASKLQWLCSNPTHITAMGNAGRRFALQKFNAKKLRLQLKRVYRSLLNTLPP